MATKAAEKKPEMKETRKKIPRKQQYIYIGPVILKGQYIPGKIVKDIPENIEKLSKDIPALKQMFVKVEEFSRKKGELNKENSALKTMYTKVEKWNQEVSK